MRESLHPSHPHEHNVRAVCVEYGNMWRGDCCHVAWGLLPCGLWVVSSWPSRALASLLVLNGGSRIIAALSACQLFGYLGLYCGAALLLRVIVTIVRDRAG